MTFGTIGSVASVPEVSIARWRLLEIDAWLRLFVGAYKRDCSGRVSFAFVAFD